MTINYFRTMLFVCLVLLTACKDKPNDSNVQTEAPFDYNVTKFADIGILRYKIPAWDSLSLKQQKFVYYLTQAGLSGRDIIWDQNYRHNLTIRKAFEHIYIQYKGDKTSRNWQEFDTYLKRIWFANGIHRCSAHWRGV